MSLSTQVLIKSELNMYINSLYVTSIIYDREECVAWGFPNENSSVEMFINANRCMSAKRPKNENYTTRRNNIFI